MTASELSEIAQLSISKSLQLAEDIRDIISPDEVPLSEAQRAELDRMLHAYRAVPQNGAVWKEVKQRI